VEVRERPLEHFVEMIRKKRPFSYSRWGDGEWKSVFGHSKGYDKDGHSYFPQMAVDLRLVLENRPEYMLGLPGEVQHFYGDNVKVWLGSKRLHDLDWVDADVFHDASSQGRFDEMITALREAPALVMVGPPHLSKLNKFLNYREFVTVPPKNCYLALKSMVRETLAVSDHLPQGTVISISAGMPAKLMVDQLHRRLGKRHTVVDFGSVWDPYVGVCSREYMKKMDVEVDGAERVDSH
jgi:hypothetical protein